MRLRDGANPVKKAPHGESTIGAQVPRTNRGATSRPWVDMKVVCDNCGSAYRVPDEKLQKPINKAVCRGCGYRLMIPRPQPGHDPDQRTIVHAVPPKKPGASSGASDPGQRSDPRGRNSDPGRRSDPARRSATSSRVEPASRPRPSRPSQATSVAKPPTLDPETMPIEDAPQAMKAMGPELQSSASPDTPTAVRTPSHPSIPSAPRSPSVAPGSRPIRGPSQPSAPMARGAPSTPGVRNPSHASLDRRSAAPPSPRRSGPPSVPSTASRAAGPAIAHNPAVNYVWTLLGLGVGGVGFLVSLVTFVVDHPVVVFAGSGMLVGGLLLSALVAISGGNGKRPPRVVSSLTTSVGVAALVASTIVSVRFALDSNHIWARTPPPLPPPTPVDEAMTPENNNPTGIPVEAVQPLVENNLGVKRCFVPMFRTNTLPPRVDVAFTISPGGKASEISVAAPERFVGTELEECLVKAIGDLEFPKSTGKGTSFVYPLIIR